MKCTFINFEIYLDWTWISNSPSKFTQRRIPFGRKEIYALKKTMENMYFFVFRHYIAHPRSGVRRLSILDQFINCIPLTAKNSADWIHSEKPKCAQITLDLVE